MYVRDPLRVVVTGPLSSHIDGFCAALERWVTRLPVRLNWCS